MGIRAAPLITIAVAVMAVTATGCRRAPVVRRSDDAGGGTIGAPSVGDAARDTPDAGVEPSADAPADISVRDTPAADDIPSDRVPADSSDSRPADQPCGPQGFNCAPFACDVMRGVCKSTCATNDDCVTGQTCNGRGGCVPVTCAADNDCGELYWCTSGRCAPCNATCVSSAVCVAPSECIMRNLCTYCGVRDGGTGL